ncbi:MAG: hypothetical protein OIF57_05795 [Marinobacterium sp.]|nr:hypothetical protein [Marinobacterium sp.]
MKRQQSFLPYQSRLKRGLVTCLLAFSLPAAAHNVVGGVYAIGTEIEGEAGFSNGDSAKPGLKVEVLDANGTLLGSTVTEDEGFFRFQATRRVEHRFRIEMGSGHLLEVSLPADELPESLSDSTGNVVINSDASTNGALISGTVIAAGVSPASGVTTAIDQAALQAVIEKAVARQIAPLRKELNAYKEKAGLRDILGGMGYIFGLCGLMIMLRNRKQNEKTD